MSFTSWNPRKLTFLITGSASGFGLALTRLALQNNHTVIATSRNSSRREEIESLGGQWHYLDLNSPDCASLISTLENAGTHIDVLVNAAGLPILGPAETFTDEQVRLAMETAFFGPFRLIRGVAPHMRNRRRGMIVNFSSGAGVDGRDGMAVYGAGKSAMDGLLRVMSKELSQFNVRCLTIPLGGFDTNFSYTVQKTEEPWPADYDDSMANKVVNAVQGSSFLPGGDHIKATQVIYDMIVGQGVGEGKEGETLLPLGEDMGAMMDRVIASMEHSMATFRDVCTSVSLDKKPE